MRHAFRFGALLLAAVFAAGCSEREINDNEPGEMTADNTRERTPVPPPNGEPARVTVDHILIGVTGALPGCKRSRAKARTLAYELKLRLEGGEDWHVLKDEYSDDRSPARGTGGPYAMANTGQPLKGATARKRMVRAFGDVGFSLGVGEIGMADFDPKTSKFGYHIIKRVK